MLHSICQQIWKTQQWPRDWKRSVFIPIQKCPKCPNYHTIALISHASNVMPQILQARLQHCVNRELPAGFRKRRTRDQIANIHWIKEKARKVTVWITTNCGKFLKRWAYQTTWSVSWEICMQAKKQQLEPDMEQQTGSKLGKEYLKALYCHPAYLTYMQSTSCKILDWKTHKLESRLPGELATTSNMQMTLF